MEADRTEPIPAAPDPDGSTPRSAPDPAPAAVSPDPASAAMSPARAPRRRPLTTWLVAAGFGLLGIILAPVVVWSVWGSPSTLVAQVRDELGLDQVETHAALLRAAAEESDVDPCLLAGIMYSESRGRSGQTSSKGALGLMQLSLAAAGDSARRLGLDAPEPDDLLHDDELNIRLAADHLAWLLRHAGEWDLEAVLVSYNAGRSRLFDWISDAGGSYQAWRRRELRRKNDGERTTGALDYARQTLAARDAFEARGEILLPGASGVSQD